MRREQCSGLRITWEDKSPFTSHREGEEHNYKFIGVKHRHPVYNQVANTIYKDNLKYLMEGEHDWKLSISVFLTPEGGGEPEFEDRCIIEGYGSLGAFSDSFDDGVRELIAHNDLSRISHYSTTATLVKAY